MLEIPAHVLKHGPWSISKAGVIEKCSLQYDFKYGPNKIPEPPRDFGANDLGVAVHKALELALEGMSMEMRGLEGMSVKNALMHAGDQNGLTINETEQLNTFFDQITRFVKEQRMFCIKHGVQPQNVMMERRMAIKPDFTGTAFFDKTSLFRGVIDYAVLTAKKDLIVTDHKSGKEKEMKYFEAQCKAYCLMAAANIPDLRGVQTCINFVMTDKPLWNKYVTVKQIRDEYAPWLINHLTDSCVGLLSDPTPKKGWYCDWCSYRPLCPAYGGTGRPETPKEEKHDGSDNAGAGASAVPVVPVA